jgi:hypothetical protein
MHPAIKNITGQQKKQVLRSTVAYQPVENKNDQVEKEKIKRCETHFEVPALL